MTKLNSFVTQFVAIVKGDNAEVQGAKAWRSAESALKVQIASLGGDLIRKEDNVSAAQESIRLARVNNGQAITDRDQYVANLISAKEQLVRAEKALKAHQETIKFLEEEYANLKAE